MKDDIFIHPSAINESSEIGRGTRVWAFAHVMKNALIGENCNIGDHAFIESGAMLGNGVTVKNGVYIWEGVKLEDYVFVGPGAVFTNDLYPRSPRHPALAQRYSDKRWLTPTLVREGASIGANATIRCGITIGRYALIAAGTVATKDVPDHALIVGSPGRCQGFVCICAARIEPPSLRCQSCGRAYETRNEKIVLQTTCY